MVEITLIAAFIAGLASFVSPCVLPLIPAFLSYLAGVSLKEGLTNAESKIKIFLNTFFFVLGFVVVFSAFGVAINSILVNVSYDLMQAVSKIGGIVIILFGLFTLGIFSIPFLEREYKMKPIQTRYAYLTSFIFGATFAVGWTPCVGAILGSIFTLAFTQPGSAFSLLFTYAAGMGIPFLITGAFTAQASEFIRKHGRAMRYLNKAMGVVLIIIGILVFTGNLVKLANLAVAGSYLGV